jgi:hypothetical protein
MLSVLFFISSTVLPGLAVASFLKTRAWFLAYGLGTALISFELFLYFVILRLPFSAFLFWFFGAQTILAVVLLIIRLPWRKQVIIRIGEIKPLAWLLGIIIAVVCARWERIALGQMSARAFAAKRRNIVNKP